MLRLIIIAAAGYCVGVVYGAIDSGYARAAFLFLVVVFGAWVYRVTLRRWERKAKRTFKRGWVWGGKLSAGCAAVSIVLLLAFGTSGFPVTAGLIALGGMAAGCMARDRHGPQSVPLAAGGIVVCALTVLIVALFSLDTYLSN